MSNPSPYSVTARATVTVTDLAALVAQVDQLVELTDEFEPIEEGTFWDGWEDREGTGYRGPGDGHYLDDDPGAMVNLAVGLAHLRAKGVEVESDASADEDTGGRFEVELEVTECEIVAPRSATGWLGALKGCSPTILQARVAMRLLETLAGVEVEITSLIAERHDIRVSPRRRRVVVTDGGRPYETNEFGRLVNPPSGYPADRSGRRPLRLDGATARTVVHFLHPIPIGRGFLMAWTLENAPGWDGNGVTGAVGSAGLIERRPKGGSMPRLIDGVLWVDIETSGVASRVELDPAVFTRRPSSEAQGR